MATIDKLYKSMGLPMNIKRGNPWPLDVSSVWYSYEEMSAYATDAAGVAYVGQVLALVDEEHNTATAFIITDKQGTLKEVGAGIITDDRTMMIDEESEELGLKDFGKRFYKYIPEVKDDDGQVVTEATYKLTVVDENSPWAAGLEPRVVLEDGELVLGWFEPNPTTIEGVNNQVSAIQSSVSDLQKLVNSLDTEVGNPSSGSEAASGIYAQLESKIDANKVYTKEETDSTIAAAISDADHLRRKIVTSYADITTFISEQGADEASKYIFMVPETDSTADGNIYEEYMVINGIIEVIGRWATDLSDYATKDDLNTSLENYVLETELVTKLADYATSVDLQQVASEVAAVNAALGNKVDKIEGSRLITEEEAEKLAALNVNGEENFIKKVTDDFAVSEDSGTLSLNKDSLDLSNNINILAIQTELATLKSTTSTNTANISALEQSIATNKQAITELQNSNTSLLEKVAANEQSVKTLTTQLTDLTTAVEKNSTDIANVVDSLNGYVLKTDYDKDIAELREILTWQEIGSAPAE